MKPGHEVIEVNFEKLKALKERARQGPLGEEDYRQLEATIETLSRLIEMIGDKDTTISSLRALLSKPGTEKTSKTLMNGRDCSLPGSCPHGGASG